MRCDRSLEVALPMSDVEKTKRSEKSLQPYRFLLNERVKEGEKMETINQLIISSANKIDDSLSFLLQNASLKNEWKAMKRT